MLPVVPMFHANSWCIPYAAAIAGFKLVICADNRCGNGSVRPVRRGRGDPSAGVPTVWLSLIDHVERHGREPGQAPHDHRRRIVGAARDHPLVPRARNSRQPFVGNDRNVADRHGRSATRELGFAERGRASSPTCARPGRSMFGVELRIVDDDGNVLPRDGKSSGRLQTRGPAVVKPLLQTGPGLRRRGAIGSTPATSAVDPSRQQPCGSPTVPRT